jgi:predicted permease
MAKWWRRHTDADIDEEFATHLALETSRQIDNGLPATDARDAAMRRFGNVLRYREDTRAVAGLVWWEQVRHDVRDAFRAIARRRLASAAAIVALGVGMGGPAAFMAILLSISTAVFPAVKDPDRLVMIWETGPREPERRRNVTRETLQVWRTQASFVRQLSATQPPTVLSLLTRDALPENVTVQPIAVDLLSLLDVAPETGRAFLATDDRADAAPVGLVSHAFWQTRFGGRADIVGSSLTLDGRAVTIVGVMPRGFWFVIRDVDLWVPFPAADRNPGAAYHVVARMNDGDDKASVAGRFAALTPQVAAAHPDREAGWGVRVDDIGPRELIAGGMHPGILMLISAAALGLLAACANIAMVMVARGAARQKETAVRSALGAGRGRLVRQFLTESIVVALAGGAMALVIAYGALRLVITRAPADLISAIAVGLDWRLIAGVTFASVVVGLLSGMAPALSDSRVNLVGALKETGYFGGSPSRSRLRRGLIVAEVTITVMLLACVGLLVRGVIDLEGTSPGFDPNNLLVLRLDSVQHIGRAATPPPDVDLLIERIGVIPGVQSVATARATLPEAARRQPVRTRGSATREGTRDQAPVNFVSAAYFRTLGLRVIDGRGFTAVDDAGASTAVVSESFVRRRFRGERVIGNVVRVGDEQSAREIIGVVSDVLARDLRREAIPIVYLPYSTTAASQEQQSTLTLLVRTTPGANVIGEIRRVVADINPLQTISSIRRINEVLAVGAQEVRVAVYLTAPILLLAVLLTMSGIYGLLAQTVTQRAHELAVRVALGAGRDDLLRLVVMQGLRLAGTGAVAGAVGALLLDRALGSFLFGVPAEQPVALAGAALLVVCVTLAASIVPCRRALHINPGQTLRYE